MKRLKAVKAVVNGVTVRKVAVRDLAQYPDTDAGDAAILADIQGSRIPLSDRPTDNRIIGTVAPRVNEIRTDSGGRKFVATKTLLFTKTVLPFPPKEGISVPLPEQTAQGVVNYDRFSTKNLLRDKLVIFFGPWYSQPELNQLFAKGVNAVNQWPNFRLDGLASSTLSLDPAKKFYMYDDDVLRSATRNLLNDPANQNSPYRDTWNTFANAQDYSTGHAAAFLAIGAELYKESKFVFDSSGRGLGYFSLDLESTSDYQFNRECLGNVYEGFCAAAASDNHFPKAITYGQNTFEVPIYDFSLKQAVTGFPEYLRDYKDLFPDPAGDATIKSLNDHNGYLADDGYFQHLWPEDQNIMLRDASNHLILDANGKPQFNTAPTQGTAYGQTFPLVANEAEGFSKDFRRHFGRKYVNRYWAAGRYPATEADRRSGMENIKHAAYTRITGEGVAGVPYNDRPIPAAFLKMIKMGNLFESDASIAWGDDYNKVPGLLGDASSKWAYNAGGTTEAMLDAIEDYAYYDDYHVGNAKRAWFNLDIVSSNQIEGEYVWNKPVLKVKIRTIAGKQYIQVYAAWPELDKTSCDIKLWIIKNNKTSSAYTITIPSGRQYHYSMFLAPADTEFMDLSGDDLRARYVDMVSVTRTLIGRYELQPTLDTSIPTPADYDTGAVVTTTPTNPAPTAGALSFGTVTYDGPNNRLKIPVTGAVGTITYHIPGVGDFTEQPAAGFTLPGNAVNTLVMFTVRTATQAEIAGRLQCNSSTTPTTTPTDPAPTTPTPSTGYFSNHFVVAPVVYVSLEGDPNVLAGRLRVIQTVHDNGGNAVCLVAVASSMQYQNWDSFNVAANKANSLGMKIILRYAMDPTLDWIGHAATDFLPALPANVVHQVDYQGNVFTNPGNTVSLSLCDPVSLNYYVSVATLWTNYFKTQSWSSAVIGVEAAFGGTGELQFDFNAYVGQNSVGELVSYDAPGLAVFKTQMTNYFGTIGALNSACNTNFASFDALTFPVPSSPGNLDSAFNGVYGSFFALHRVYVLKRFVDGVYGVFANLVPDWLRILDAGSYDDNLSLQRGTSNSVLLEGSLIQMAKTNGQLGFNHERNIDECCAGGRFGANELDYAQDTGSANQPVAGKYDQLYRSYARGARLVTLNCYNRADSDLIALLNPSQADSGGRPGVASLVASGPVPINRNVVQTITFDQWTHNYDDTAYNLGQAWNALYGSNHPGIDIQYQSPTLTS